MKLYGTPLCHDCIEAFEKLKNAGISYDYINISYNLQSIVIYRYL